MWVTLLLMAAVVSVEPFRVGMTVVLLNRPRPQLQLATFLAGGFLMGISVGAVMLFVVEPRLPGSRHFTLPTAERAVGLPRGAHGRAGGSARLELHHTSLLSRNKSVYS